MRTLARAATAGSFRGRGERGGDIVFPGREFRKRAPDVVDDFMEVVVGKPEPTNSRWCVMRFAFTNADNAERVVLNPR
ncbi:hypothetical protein [Arthrobacter monumenti]